MFVCAERAFHLRGKLKGGVHFQIDRGV
jgi:hypothetical protein